ncbi:protein PAT1 homolog 1 [Lingula anatina]|uniref:Protein PAT1 homolog 1 n=1 Tax=Lingula anatina TaxID=7574 RepID=A0A1S3JU61_LINAN|nr:protein PAT1 homolog 1 [Lingula anatina]|eukprot:XP_013413910.1 protein PAT1 homolog 1 [Lingula anatina]
MADSFFGFETDLPTLGVGKSDFDNELREAPEEEDVYDMMNDETFGAAEFDGDWEEQHELLAGEIEKHDRTGDSGFDTSEKKYEGQEEDMEQSISHLVLDDDELDDPAIVNVSKSRPIPMKKQSLEEIFGPASPPALLDTEDLVSPGHQNIWSSPSREGFFGRMKQDSGFHGMVQRTPIQDPSIVVAGKSLSSSLPTAKTASQIEQDLKQMLRTPQAKAITVEELEREMQTGVMSNQYNTPRSVPPQQRIATQAGLQQVPQEDMEQSISHLVLDDDELDDPAIVNVSKSRPIPMKKQSLEEIFGPASPPALLDTEDLVSPGHQNIWSSPSREGFFGRVKQDSGFHGMVQRTPIQDPSIVVAGKSLSSSLPTAKTASQIEQDLKQMLRTPQAKAITVEELEREMQTGVMSNQYNTPRSVPPQQRIATQAGLQQVPQLPGSSLQQLMSSVSEMGRTSPAQVVPQGRMSPAAAFNIQTLRGSPQAMGMQTPANHRSAARTPSPPLQRVVSPHAVSFPMSPYQARLISPYTRVTGLGLAAGRISPTQMLLGNRMMSPQVVLQAGRHSPPPGHPMMTSPMFSRLPPTPMAMSDPSHLHSNRARMMHQGQARPPMMNNPNRNRPAYPLQQQQHWQQQQQQQQQHHLHQQRGDYQQQRGDYPQQYNNYQHRDNNQQHWNSNQQQRGDYRQRDYHHQQQRDHHNGPGQQRWKKRDEYADLMTQKEKDWIIRIQLMQLQTENPFLDDYYYTTYMMKKMAKEREAQQAAQAEEEESKEPKLLLPQIAKVETRTYRPAQFENALGRLTSSSVHNPRQILDIASSPHTHAEEGEYKGKDLRKYREILIDVELAYTLLLDIEDIEKKVLALPDEASKPLLQERRSKIGELYTKLHVDDDRFTHLMIIRKGKKLVARSMTLFDKEQNQSIVSAVIQHLAHLIKKDQTDKVLHHLHDPVHRTISAVDMELLGRFAQSLCTVQKSGQQDSIGLILQNKFGASTVYSMLSRAETLHEEDPLDSQDNQLQDKWSSFVNRIAEVVGKTAEGSLAVSMQSFPKVPPHLERLANKNIYLEIESKLEKLCSMKQTSS